MRQYPNILDKLFICLLLFVFAWGGYFYFMERESTVTIEGGLSRNPAHITEQVRWNTGISQNNSDTLDAVDDYEYLLEDQALFLKVLNNDHIPSSGVKIVVFAPYGNSQSEVDLDGYYRMPLNYVGNDTLYYVLEDASGYRDTAFVYIEISPIDDVVIAYDDEMLIQEEGEGRLNVIINDELGDGYSHAQLDKMPKYADSVYLDTEGVLYYRGQKDYFGWDTLSYIVYDINQDYSIATVIIHIEGVNDTLQANRDTITIYSLEPSTLDILENDLLGDGSLNIHILIPPERGELMLDSIKRVLTFRPYEGFLDDTFTYQIQDVDRDISQAEVQLISAITPDAEDVINSYLTPNNDGHNDYLRLATFSTSHQYTLTIFNHRGQEIYYDPNYQNNWRGEVKGSVLPDGVYFYLLKSSQTTYKGSFYLKK
ncbi:gliding motility-associated C-terminal domain-containing protein [Algivirga pacifica]|uniref:Gliding motility-associated C-terminal domain-containing protein n=1 Tax=Algivirga pacifica TaxID=1162670 RepID=A0ABP9DGA4_9BACT